MESTATGCYVKGHSTSRTWWASIQINQKNIYIIESLKKSECWHECTVRWVCCIFPGMLYSTWAPTTVTWETLWMVLGENIFSCNVIQRITSPFSWNYCSIWVIFQVVCRQRLHWINKKLSLHSIWKQGLLKVLSKINKGHKGHFFGKSFLFCCKTCHKNF